MKTYFDLGEALALADSDLDPAEFRIMKSAHACLHQPRAAEFHRQVAKIAAAAYEACGEARTPEGILFEKLAHEQHWHPGYYRITDCVLRALGRVEKSAGLAGLLPGVLANTGVDTGIGIGRGVMGGSAAVGGLGGALAFLLMRDARQTSVQNQDLLEKTRAYRRVRKEIGEDMSSSGLLPAQNNAAAPSLMS